jgi:hypothetical protein
MFLYVVIAVAVVLVALLRIVTWRADQKGTGRKGKRIASPYTDEAVGEAKAMRAIRNLSIGPRDR